MHIGKRNQPRVIAGWMLGFFVVAALGLASGGYDPVARGRVGVAMWWIVLLGACIGTFPRRVSSAAWTSIGLLAALALWIGLGSVWSESAERSVIELARVTMYLGVLVLGICAVARTGARSVVAGVASAIAFIAVLAVLSRLQPQWFPRSNHIELFGEVGARRLSYPLNYWNALGALMAMGVPLLLALAVGARTVAARVLSVTALPVLALCLYLTISRGSVLVAVVAVAVLLALAPRRLALARTLALAGAGAALLIAVARSQPALRSGLDSAQARSEGDTLLLLSIVACVAVGLALWGLERLVERIAWRAPRWRKLSRGTALGAVSVAAVAVVVAALALGAGGEIQDRWEEFKVVPVTADAGPNDLLGRLAAVNGTGRYQLWEAAIDANRSHPWRGIGPGTFEFWWSRNPTTPLIVRDAHNLYLETLAEAGVVGLALLVAFFAWVLICGVRRARQASGPARLWIAAATAVVAAFMTSALLDWTWEMAVAPASMLLMAAVVLADVSGRRMRNNSIDPRLRRTGLGALAIVAAVIIAVPLAGAVALRTSQQAGARGDLGTALSYARSAERLQPWAASPLLQQALVHEQAGRIQAASEAARQATDAEATNWRTWLIRARVSRSAGDRAEAASSRARLRALNPRRAGQR